MLISFEGPEGSGKSTQINLLSNYLEAQNINYICIREPGGTLLSEEIREILKSDLYSDLSKESELLLFLASRSQLVNQIIKPSLLKNKFVLCDRYIDSTLAYQGYGRQISLKNIELLNNFTTGGLEPNITFLLQLDVHNSLERINKRYKETSSTLDRIEKEEKFFHQRVHDGYNEIAKNNKRVIKINAMQSIDVISKKIQMEVDKYRNN